MDNFNENFKIIICQNIKNFRKESGLSVLQVSELVEVSPEYFKRIESPNDSRKNCSLTLLYKLSLIFNKHLDDFFIDNKD